jgi:mannose-6-phosphate isomerase-like protein (cupin superfamily)
VQLCLRIVTHAGTERGSDEREQGPVRAPDEGNGRGYARPGAKHDVHRHPNAEEVEYIVSGSGVAQVGEADVEISAGELVFVPANEYHGFHNTSDGETVMVWTYAPAASLEEAGYIRKADDQA